MPTSPRRRLELKQPYRPRPVSFLELWQHGAWRMKLYGLSAVHQKPAPELLAAAKATAAGLLPASPESQDAYGVGFVGIHEGTEYNLVFIDWWAKENELHHRVFHSPVHSPAALTPADDGVTACVWDLQLIWFERNAWVEKVLANPLGPDLEAYLTRHLSDQA